MTTIVPALLVAGYMVLWLTRSPSLFQDLPNHLARAEIISSLIFDSNSPFRPTYAFIPTFTPYILGDLILVGLVKLFSVEVAGRLAMLLAFLLTPLGLMLFLAARRANREAIALAAVGGFYLGSDWMFLTGYINYRLGVGIAFCTLAVWEYLQRSESSRSPLGTGLLVLGIVSCYLLHLSAFLFVGVAFTTFMFLRAARRTLQWRPALIASATGALLSAFHICADTPGLATPDDIAYPPFSGKVLHVFAAFMRFDSLLDVILFGGFILAILLAAAAWATSKVDRTGGTFFDCAVGAGVFTLIYFVFPERVRNLDNIDLRALPYAFGFLMLAATVASTPSTNRGRTLLQHASTFLLLAVSVANFSYLVTASEVPNAKAMSITSAVEALPPGKRLLPIATLPDYGRVQIGLHTAVLYAALGRGDVPFLFARQSGYAMHYFTYQSPMYAPSEFWYLRNESIDWTRVRSDYDYVLITKPYDPARIPNQGFAAVSETADTVLFEVQKEAPHES